MQPSEPARQPMSRRHVLVLVGLGALLVYLLVRREILGENELIFFAVLFPSVILHEVSHGALALAFGDDTAKQAGRLTLNPVPHIDPFGTVILPALLLVTTGSAFGWAKPVPVDPSRLDHPRNQTVLVSLVGPAVNIAVAVAAALLVRLVQVHPDDSLLIRTVLYLGLVNVVLAAFNLLPIPPLDGSAVVERFLPDRLWPGYLRFRKYSIFVLLGLVLLVPGALSRVFDPVIGLWQRLLG
ncbi:MAG: site-2 protease family protein [Actinomycetota bacterium]|nr:site-2 protease family protein [Actinomycetota bacterium]